MVLPPDIPCDYFLISPFCGVAQTPDCGMLVLHLSFVSPLCGVAPTPDCGIIISAFSARGVIQTLVWHQYYYSAFSARGVIQTLVWHQYYYSAFFLLEESLRHSLGPSILFWYIFNHMCASWSFVFFVINV